MQKFRGGACFQTLGRSAGHTYVDPEICCSLHVHASMVAMCELVQVVVWHLVFTCIYVLEGVSGLKFLGEKQKGIAGLMGHLGGPMHGGGDVLPPMQSAVS